METKKDSSIFINMAAHSALGFVKLKNSIFRRISKATDVQHPYAERVSKDDYAPFVKSSFRADCNSKYPEEKPMGRLRRSSNIADVFRHAVQMHGDRPCMGYRPLMEIVGGHFEGRPVKKLKQGGYKFHSYESVDHLVDCYGRGLLQIGIRPLDKVAILADTCFDWMCMALALMRYNMPIVTLYATLSEEGIIHGLNQTGVSIVITSHELLEKMRDHFGEIDTLRHVVYMDKPDRPVPREILGKEMMSLRTLRNLGDSPKNEFHPIPPKPEDIAILMYTSGSTGVPKAVKITHGNMLAAAKGLGDVFESIKIRSDDAYIAYLPLAHVFELTCELLAILFGVRIGYSSPTTLTDNSPCIIPGDQGDCAILQPTIMAAVPLMLDRIKKAVIRKCSSKGALSARVLELAIDDTIRRYQRGLDATVYDKDIFAQIRSVIGGRVRLIATGSAPLSPETHSFIRAALGCLVLQGYGLTESSAAATVMEVTDTSTGGVGCPVVGAYVKLEDWAEGGYFVKDNKGEIILGGEMISPGYFENDLLTDECFFDKDGIRWFRTGDIGEVTEKGTFKIIDRKKDLVKLQHGEYISLGKVESELKTMNIVENICAYGSSHQDFIVALIQPNMAMLTELAKEKQRPCTEAEEMVNDPVLTELVQEMIQAHSKAIGFLRKEIPSRIKLCAQEWTPESGLVTAAMKLCRKEIQRKYQSELDTLYG